MFTAYNRVRMHDTDMAGILYFARQFRFAHDALEDFIMSTGMTFDQAFRKEKFVFVIVHAEADYFASLRVGDTLKIELLVEHVGDTSFSIGYHIYKEENDELVGTVKTVHVTLDAKKRTKISIPQTFRNFLSNHLVSLNHDGQAKPNGSHRQKKQVLSRRKAS